MPITGLHYLPRLVADIGSDPPLPQRLDIDGALLFVDVSGFTALSEALAGHGRIGAEAITRAITTTFTALLTTAGSLGGDLLKFGGDALLLLFCGEDAATRAAAAAAGMHADLERVGTVGTPTGRIELGMSAGIAAGRVRLFLVGADHIELVVAGEVADAVAEAESTATRGETVLASDVSSLLPSEWLAGNGRLRHGAATAERVTWAPPPDQDVTRWIPKALRGYIGEFADDGEHRSAAVGFARVTGLEAPATPQMVDAIHAVVCHTQRQVHNYGVTFLGTDLSAGGFKMVLVAGVPEAHVDNEERMLRAARAVAAAQLPLPVAIGVHAGSLFAGDVGAPTRRTYTVMGDTVNLAARLASRAAPGEVLASHSAVDRARSTFDVVAVAPFRVKGKSRPVDAVLVGEPSDRWTPTQATTRLVGREGELAIFETAVRRAVVEGCGTLIDLVAEPGMGKTRLVDEATAVAGVPVHVTAGGEYLTHTPYAPFRHLLRELLGIPDDHDPNQAGARLTEEVLQRAPRLTDRLPLLAIPIDGQVASTRATELLAPRFRAARLHDAVSELMTAILPRPTMLIFEDAHWFDNASVDLLAQLATVAPDRPWVLCVTRRPEGQSPLADMAAATMTLAPLPPEDAALLVALAAGHGGLLPGRVERVVERSGGNPLFALELTSGLSGSTGDEFPETLEALLANRIDALALEDRRVLRRAAVLGRELDPDLLPVATGRPDFDWTRLADFVEPSAGDRLRFRHAMIREVAYGALPYRQRREIHGRIASHLERTDDPPDDQLSLHSFLGGRYRSAWRHSVSAAERAAQTNANADSARLYNRALEARRHTRGVIPPGEAAQVAESLGDVATLAGMYDRSLEAYSSARRWARGDSDRQATVSLKRARVQELLGNYRTALRLLTRLIGETSGGTDEQATRVEATLTYAGIRFRQGRYRECARWSRDAVGLAERLGVKASVAHGYYLLSHTLTYLDEESTDFAERALSMYQELGDPVGAANVLNNMGVEAYNDGRWDEAVALQARHEATRIEAGDVVGAAIAGYNRGLMLLEQGRLDEADSVFARVRSTAAAAHHGMLSAAVIGCLGSLAARRGDHPAATALLDDAARRFSTMGSSYFELDIALRVADAHLSAGRYEEAAAMAEAHLDKAVRGDGLQQYAVGLRRIKGLAMIASGDEPTGRELLEEAMQEAAAHTLRYEELLALRALGYTKRAGELATRLGVISLPPVELGRR